MDKKILLAYLNWFYTLELEQVTLYQEQARIVNDDYMSEVLIHLAKIEDGHVQNISESIRQLGANPSRIGGIIGPAVGKPFSELSSLFGIEKMFKVNILLETKASQDYSNLIKRVNDVELLKVLKNNLIEEDLHRSWFITRRNRLKDK